MEKLLHVILSLIAIVLLIFLIACVSFIVNYLRSGAIHRKRKIKPSLIDKMLFYERNPFSWRIGFAYSLLGYNQNQIDEFNKALYQVITAEKKVFLKYGSGKFRFLIKKMIQGKSSFDLIEKYTTTLSSHAILNETEPDESLDYLLFLEIDRFLNSTVEKLKREQRNLPEGRPPFRWKD